MYRKAGNLFLSLGILLAAFACKQSPAPQNKSTASDNKHNVADPRKYMFDQSAEAEVMPAELIPFIYAPYVAFSFEECDLNQDGLQDYLLVLAQPYQKDASGEDDLSSVPENAPAPVLVILRQKDKTLKFHSKNEVAFTQETVQPGAAHYAGITADTLGRGFEFYFHSEGAGATASYTDLSYQFEIDKKADKFFLKEIKEETGLVSPGGAREFMIRRAIQDGEPYDSANYNYEENFPETTVTKVKAGQYEFSKFVIPYLNGEEIEYE
jgi:hypothetical protein